MKVSGSLILDTLATLREEAQLVKNEYSQSLTYYKSDEVKEDPEVHMQKYVDIQVKIAKLQELQSAYNLFVKVTVNEEEMSLTRAINLIGDMGFVKNQWTSQLQNDAYSRNYRQKDVELPVKSIDSKTAKVLMKGATKTVGAYKSAIREGNVTPVELTVLTRKFDLNISEDVFEIE